MTYQRNAQLAPGTDPSTLIPPSETEAAAIPPKADQRVKVDGFGQVIEMLRSADPDFRESLLRRLTQQDPVMGANLRATLRQRHGL